MKKLIAVFAFALAAFAAQAQNEVPKGYEKGGLVLSDGSIVNGYIRDNIRSKAAVNFIENSGTKKKNYEGSDLQAAEINGVKYICINGDFFKVISQGELDFLQKASDASSKPVYAAGETLFSNGTAGAPGDYFIYDTRNSQLKHVNKKTVGEVAIASFSGCTAAIEKAKLVNDELSMLKEAVDLYNKRNL
jgi:hypothetical protein